MTFTTETLAGMHTEEIHRAIDRLRAARRAMREEIERLEAELAERAERRDEKRR